MQSEIDETHLLKIYIARLELENDKIKAENLELKTRVVKLEDKQLQNELVYLYCEKRNPILMLAGKSDQH